MKNNNDNQSNFTLTSSKEKNSQQNSPHFSKVIKTSPIQQEEALSQKSVNKPSRLFNIHVFAKSPEKTSVDNSSKNLPTSPTADRSNIDNSSKNLPTSPVADRSDTSRASSKSLSNTGESHIVGPIIRSTEFVSTVDQPKPRVLNRRPPPSLPHSPSPEEGSVQIPRPLKVKRPDIENPYPRPKLEKRTQPSSSNETEESIKIGVATSVESLVEQGAGDVKPTYSIGISAPTYLSKDVTSIDFRLVGVVFLVSLSISTISILLVKLAMGQLTEEQEDKEEEEEKKKLQPPSFFISTFLVGDKVDLDQFVIATINLTGVNKKVKKGMIGQIIGIIDETQGCVLIEMFAEEFSSFDQEINYISAFIKLPRMGQIKIQAKHSLQFLQKKVGRIGAFFFS